jgi:2-keto-3-deoxy-L-fuconate dehydrogenase
MSSRLTGMVVVVTAAGQGIGRAIAHACAVEGATVWATDINQATLDTLAREHPGLQARVVDVRDTGTVRALAEETGAVDALVNCAGIVHGGTLLDCGEDDWDVSFDVNVKSMYRTCSAFLPGMIERARGSIVNISSVASSVKGVPNRCVYGATKAAVIGLTKGIAADFVARGIRANAICPGTIHTPSLEERMGPTDEMRQAFIARQPMGRFGRAEEVAALAVYLIADESSFTTGQTHIIDGGWIG